MDNRNQFSITGQLEVILQQFLENYKTAGKAKTLKLMPSFWIMNGGVPGKGKI